MFVSLSCVAVQKLHTKIADARYHELDRLYLSYVFRWVFSLLLWMSSGSVTKLMYICVLYLPVSSQEAVIFNYRNPLISTIDAFLKSAVLRKFVLRGGSHFHDFIFIIIDINWKLGVQLQLYHCTIFNFKTFFVQPPSLPPAGGKQTPREGGFKF